VLKALLHPHQPVIKSYTDWHLAGY